MPLFQVPVPANTKLVVPLHTPVLLDVRLPVMFIVFPFKTGLTVLFTKVAFVTVISFGKVVVPELAIKGPVGLKVFAPIEKLRVPVAERERVPVMFRFDESVVVNVVPPNVKLFQFKAPVLNVVAAETLSVDPVVTTVPAVYVIVPVS